MVDRSLLGPRTVRMPDFAPGEWINTEHPLDKSLLRGRAVLVDFWDYTCVNCIRTLPYLTKWHERYARYGLVIIGVHAPEFNFARTQAQVTAAVQKYNIPYPVLLDNEYQTWDRFANRAWPTKYLIDADGYLRYRRQGEGFYAQTEQALQEVLVEMNAGLTLPPVLPPLRAEDRPGAVCYRTTPELYAGYERGSLGNPEGYAAHGPLAYRMPIALQRAPNQFYAGGLWQATEQALAFAGQQSGLIVLPYEAAGVNAVLSPSADPVEVLLKLRRTESPPVVEVRLDGAYVTPEQAGADIEYDAGGLSYLQVDEARMYELVQHPEHGAHELELVFRANGLALYSFTFTHCIAPGADPADPAVFQTG